MKKTLWSASSGLMLMVCLLLCASFLPAPKKKLLRPPGTVMLKSGLYFDQTEISNISWKEYLSWLKINEGENSAAYLNAKSDSSVWRNGNYTYGEPMVESYHEHPAYNSYPVVGITHSSAVNYCTWRTERVREMLKANPRIKKQYAGAWPIVKYRLPTEKEWNGAAKGVYDLENYPKKAQKDIAKKGSVFMFNLNFSTKTPAASTVPAPVRSFHPNSEGVYNLIGNVAEMVAEPGLVKGGSYIHNLEESKKAKEVDAEATESWIGFRCACDVTYMLSSF